VPGDKEVTFYSGRVCSVVEETRAKKVIAELEGVYSRAAGFYATLIALSLRPLLL
jgi:hypothetical protein